jgi:hypothetical protein
MCSRTWLSQKTPERRDSSMWGNAKISTESSPRDQPHSTAPRPRHHQPHSQCDPSKALPPIPPRAGLTALWSPFGSEWNVLDALACPHLEDQVQSYPDMVSLVWSILGPYTLFLPHAVFLHLTSPLKVFDSNLTLVL